MKVIIDVLITKYIGRFKTGIIAEVGRFDMYYTFSRRSGYKRSITKGKEKRK